MKERLFLGTMKGLVVIMREEIFFSVNKGHVDSGKGYVVDAIVHD